MLGRSSARSWKVSVGALAAGVAVLVLALLWVAARAKGNQSTGIFALAGVLAGGLITAATTWLFERRREEGDTRQARRLVAEELLTICMQFDALVAMKRAPASIEGFLPSKQWEAHRDVLARHLPDRLWDDLSIFMDTMPSTRLTVLRTSLGDPLPQDTLTAVTTARGLSAEVYELLTGKKPGGDGPGGEPNA